VALACGLYLRKLVALYASGAATASHSGRRSKLAWSLPAHASPKAPAGRTASPPSARNFGDQRPRCDNATDDAAIRRSSHRRARSERTESPNHESCQDDNLHDGLPLRTHASLADTSIMSDVVIPIDVHPVTLEAIFGSKLKRRAPWQYCPNERPSFKQCCICALSDSSEIPARTLGGCRHGRAERASIAASTILPAAQSPDALRRNDPVVSQVSIQSTLCLRSEIPSASAQT